MRTSVPAFQGRRGHSHEEKIELVRRIGRDQDRAIAPDVACRRGAAGVARADVGDQAAPRIGAMSRHYFLLWADRKVIGLNAPATDAGGAGSEGG